MPPKPLRRTSKPQRGKGFDSSINKKVLEQYSNIDKNIINSLKKENILENSDDTFKDSCKIFVLQNELRSKLFKDEEEV